MTMTNEDRMIDLETRLAHLDDTVEVLNDIVARQQQEIDQLGKQFKKMAAEQAQIKEQVAPEVTDSPPPHY